MAKLMTKMTIETQDGPMDAYVAVPEGNKKAHYPGMIVFQEAFGVNKHIQEVCKRFAREGFVAMAPELFHRLGSGVEFGYEDFDKVRPALSSLTNEKLLMDASAAFSALSAMPEVNGGLIASIGFCMGGFVSVLAAIHKPLAAAVSFYGGGMVKKREGIGFSPLIDDFKNLHCPVLFVVGDQDKSIPLSEMETIKAHLKSLQKPHEAIIYPNAGHGFFCEDRSSFKQDAAKASWQKTIEWLRKVIAPLN